MPTTLVSFLGRGRKENPQDRHSSYRRTIYQFKDDSRYRYETSLFGTALLHYLRDTGRDINRWIVLGTSGSLWSELHQILPDPNAVIENYLEIDERVIAQTVDAASLARWQEILNHHARPLQLHLCLTGEAMDPASQQAIAQALFERVPRGNELVLDITHGFRHQPVITAFIISLMRWTHDIRRVSFYSGVFEAGQRNITPVLEMPLCQQLIEATEAAAVLDITGNYAPLAQYLGLDASEAWFLENTNQLGRARRPVEQLLARTTTFTDPTSRELAGALRERLRWVERGSFADRCLEASRTALENGDYFRAVILTYEAILVRAGQLLTPHRDPLDYQTREESKSNLYRHLQGDDRSVMIDLEWTRNSIAHGTRPNRENTQHILDAPAQIQDLLRRAFELYDRLPSLLSGR